MSKLIDRLNRIAKGVAQPIGFRAASGRTKSSPMLLIAVAGSDGGAVREAREHASAILFNSAAAAEKLASEAGDLPWGVYIDTDVDRLAKLKGKGCDFIVFNAESAPASLLSDEGVGRVVELTPGIADGLARAASQLPVDAALVGGEPALSVKRLLVCQHMSNLVGKPLIARAPLDASADDVRELWETGLCGIAVDIAGDSKGKQLAGLKQAIDRLPSSRRRKGGKPDVSLPYPVVDESDIEMEEAE